ncbi:MAG: recombinase family protein [Pirellulaceae bacterium]|nr:recombinase family protein [Pirellulaceae bacterium]
MKNFIGYYRVSTDRQAQSRLGIEAQIAGVRAFAIKEGATMLAEYTEIESGKKCDRPKLLQAIAHARRNKATIVVLRLDRLSRDSILTSTILNSNIELLVTEMPYANRIVLDIISAINSDELRRISQRTVDALRAYRARGGLLGSRHPRCKPISPEASKKGQPLGAAATSKKAAEAYADLLPELIRLRNCGFSYRAIARTLNGENQTTRLGKPWNPVQVKRVLHRRS